MGYAAYLKQLLRPLGVYDLTDGSFSAGELDALGAELDKVWDDLQENQRESIVSSALSDGLTRYERLFGVLPESPTTESRRAAIAALMQVAGDSFSAAALSNCLAACGVAAQVEETDTAGTLAVSFPGRMGVPEGFARMKAILEMLLPCHLTAEYRFRYALWRDIAGLTWGRAAGMTWGELMVYRPA